MGLWFSVLPFLHKSYRGLTILTHSFTRPGVRKHRLWISQICKIRKGVNQGVVYKSSRWCFSYAQWLFATLNGGVLLSGRPKRAKTTLRSNAAELCEEVAFEIQFFQKPASLICVLLLSLILQSLFCKAYVVLFIPINLVLLQHYDFLFFIQ